MMLVVKWCWWWNDTIMMKWWPQPVVVPLLAKENVCGIGLGGCHHHYPSSSDLRHHHFSSIIFVSSQMKIKNKICVFSGYLLMKLVPNFTMLWPRSPHLLKHWALQFNSHPILQTTPNIFDNHTTKVPRKAFENIQNLSSFKICFRLI